EMLSHASPLEKAALQVVYHFFETSHFNGGTAMLFCAVDWAIFFGKTWIELKIFGDQFWSWAIEPDFPDISGEYSNEKTNKLFMSKIDSSLEDFSKQGPHEQQLAQRVQSLISQWRSAASIAAERPVAESRPLGPKRMTLKELERSNDAATKRLIRDSDFAGRTFKGALENVLRLSGGLETGFDEKSEVIDYEGFVEDALMSVPKEFLAKNELEWRGLLEQEPSWEKADSALPDQQLRAVKTGDIF